MRNTSLCSRCWSKGVGDRKEGKQGGGSGREGELLHFSPLPPPPLFVPATQAIHYNHVGCNNYR